MGTKLTPLPPRASQGQGPLCWAACTTSWLAVTPDRPQLNLKQLVDRYGDPKKKGGISFQDAKFAQLSKDLRWAATHHVDVVLKLDPKRRVRQLDLDGFAAEIEEALNVRGYLLLVDNHTPGSLISNGISHMYVVHGIIHFDGGHRLLVMDPAPDGGLRRPSVAEFAGHHVAMIGTLERMSPQRRKATAVFVADE